MRPKVTHAPYPKTLPSALRKEYDEARSIEHKLLQQRDFNPPAGRPRLWKNPSPVTTITGDTLQEVEELMDALSAVIGPKRKGNKRRGKISLYADLLQAYFTFRKLGITFPSRSNLSAKAVMYGMGEILRRHGYIEDGMFDTRLAKNTRKRSLIAAGLKGQCMHVRKLLSDKPSP